MTTQDGIKNNLTGVWVDTLTPIKEDKHIDVHRLESHLRTLMLKGTKGFLLFGNMGEGASFSAEEKAEAISQLIKSGIEPSCMMLMVSSNAATDASRLIHFAQSAHLHGVTVCAPNFYKPLNHLGLCAYFDHLMELLPQSDLKLYLHILPSSFHVDVPESVLSDIISKHGQRFQGLVNDSGSSGITHDLLKSFAALIKIHSVNELDIKILNSTGTISAMANVMPRVVHHLLGSEQSKSSTFIPGMKVKSPEDRLNEFNELLVKMPSVAAYKFLLSQIYHDSAWLNCRPPLYRLDQEQMALLTKKFKNFNLQTSEE